MENNVNVPQKIKIDLGFPGGSDGKASACNAGDPVRFNTEEDTFAEQVHCYQGYTTVRLTAFS